MGGAWASLSARGLKDQIHVSPAPTGGVRTHTCRAGDTQVQGHESILPGPAGTALCAAHGRGARARLPLAVSAPPLPARVLSAVPPWHVSELPSILLTQLLSASVARESSSVSQIRGCSLDVLDEGTEAASTKCSTTVCRAVDRGPWEGGAWGCGGGFTEVAQAEV